MALQNFNYENRFHVSFNSEKYMSLTENIVEIQLPMLSIGNTIQYTGVRDISIPGDSVEFGDVVITTLLDEDYSNYRSYFLWLKTLRDFDSINMGRNVIDISVVLLNGKFNPFISVDLFDCYPYNISEIGLNHQISNTEPIRFTTTFRVNGIDIR